MGWVREFSFDRERIAWWLVAVALLVAVGYVVVSFLGTFLLGLFVYYATRPIYRRLLGRLRQRTLTALAALVGIALPGLVLLGYTVAVSVRELSELAGVGLEAFEGVLGTTVSGSGLVDPRQLLDAIGADPAQFVGQRSTEAVGDLLASALDVVSVLATTAIGIIIVLVISFYLLRDDHRLAAWFRTEVAGPNSPTVAFAQAVDHDLETVYFGNILTAFVIAVISAVVYFLLDMVAPSAVSVPSPTLLGLLTGLASLVPVVGMKLVYLPLGIGLAAVAAATDPTLLWFPALFLLVAFVVVDTIPELLLRPYVSGRDLHTGLVLLAYVLGPVLFGWYGLFLGPLLLVLVVHFVRVVVPELLERDEFAVGTSDDPAQRPSRTTRRRPHVRAPVAALAGRERTPDGGPERTPEERPVDDETRSRVTRESDEGSDETR